MTNAIFLFMLGLTVGILLSMTLVSKFHRAQQHGLSSAESVTIESAAGVSASNRFAVETSKTSSSGNVQPSGTASTKSSWIPGREGEFLKDMNLSNTSNDTSRLDGKDLGDSNSRKSTRKRKKAPNNSLDNGIGVNGQELDSKNILSKDNLGSDIGLTDNRLMYMQNGENDTDINALSIGANMSFPVAPYQNGDNFQLQSNFFDENGVRVTNVNTLNGKTNAIHGLLYDHPPLVPYHSQSAQQHQLDPPYIPSLKSVIVQRAAQILQEIPGSNIYFASSGLNGSKKSLPNMAAQRGKFEVENLKLHLCNTVYEAYSGAFLTTKAHMLTVKDHNLTWVNCEMASFLHMKAGLKNQEDPRTEGTIMQALDVLDFSVIHLSAYERSSKKYRKEIWRTKADIKTKWSQIEPVKIAANLLEGIVNPLKSGKNLTWSEDAKKTVVIMPFLGGAMGAGHSEIGNRFDYLKACFWSIYEFMPNIVAGVSRKEDVEWCKNRSGLPFYDVMLLDKLPKAAGLPVGTTQMAKDKLRSGEWPFEFIYFTESDQILISRTLPMLFDHLKKYPSRMILPHRLMPYSKEVISMIHTKDTDAIHLNQWMNQSCCFPRQNCGSRKTWKPLADKDVGVINFYGLYVPLGNVNFLVESYRTCSLSPYIGDYCP